MIELSPKKQEEMIQLFLKHFDLEDKYDDVKIWHPQVTNKGCVHIDVGVVDSEKTTYYFTFGCSAKKNPQGVLSEIYFNNCNGINGARLLHEVTYFNNKKFQLGLLQNGEYICFDDHNPLSELSDNEFTGFFIYDSFTTTTSDGKEVHYYECVPVTKAEIDFVESYPMLPYQLLISVIKDHLGSRSDLKTAKGLSQEQLDKILDVFKKDPLKMANEYMRLSDAIKEFLIDLETTPDSIIVASKRKIDPLVFNSINDHGNWSNKVEEIKTFISQLINSETKEASLDSIYEANESLRELLCLMNEKYKDWEKYNPRLCGWLDGTRQDLAAYWKKKKSQLLSSLQ